MAEGPSGLGFTSPPSQLLDQPLTQPAVRRRETWLLPSALGQERVRVTRPF